MVLLLQMYSERLKGHVRVKDLWTSETSGCWTEIPNVPENLPRETFWKNNPPPPISDLCSVKSHLQELNPHLVLVSGSEERHVQLQAPAAVAQDVAALGCQFWRQHGRADCDLPRGAERPALQREADSRAQTRRTDVWRGCEGGCENICSLVTSGEKALTQMWDSCCDGCPVGVGGVFRHDNQSELDGKNMQEESFLLHQLRSKNTHQQQQQEEGGGCGGLWGMGYLLLNRRMVKRHFQSVAVSVVSVADFGCVGRRKREFFSVQADGSQSDVFGDLAEVGGEDPLLHNGACSSG